MGKELVNKIRGMNPLTARGGLLVWAILLCFACVFGSKDAGAAPTTTGGNAWSSVYAATAAATSVNVTSSTITPGTGANRLLLVAVHLEKAVAEATTLTTTPTFGGVELTPIGNTLAPATPQRMQTWMGFLPHASIPAGPNAVNFQASSTGNITGVQIKIAVYTGVDQSTPIADWDANVAAATSVGLNAATTPLTITADSITVVAASNGGTAPTLATAQTGGAAFTTQTAASSTVGGFGGYITVSGTNAAAGSYTALTTSYTGTTSTRSSQVAVTIKAYVASGDTIKPVMNSFTAPASSTSLTITGITMSASDNVGVTGYGITESATPPAPSSLTSPTPLTSYTATSAGTKTLYAWAKDAAGLVSDPYASQSCTITLPPKPVRAQNWTSVYGAVAYPAGNAGTYTVNAGSNRLLVVAIAATSTAVGAQSVSNVTWGGKPLTLAAGNGTLATIWNHTYIYYLKEADIASASGTTLTATITGGTGYYTRIYASVYTGVDQNNPVSSSALYENASLVTAVGPFSPALAVGAQEQAVEIVNLARNTAGTTGRTISTWATGWTTAGQAPTGIVTSGPCQQVYIRDRAVPGASVNDTSQHTASSANSFRSMAAISIKAAANGLTVTTGTTISNKSVYAGDTSVAVDAFNIVAGANDTVTNITVTGSAATTSANVSAVRIYRKVGANLAAYEAGDVQIASGTFSGNVASLTTSEALSASDARNYIIVYDIAANAAPSLTNTLNGYVSAMTATNISSLVDPVGSSATITIYPTTTIGNGASEPSAVRLYKASAATNLDAFTLVHNSAQPTDDDNISTVAVTLSPAGISGSGQVLSKISKVEVVSSNGSTVYGFMTAATTGDLWNIPTTGLVATATPASYFIRITTAANIVPGFYSVGGTITSVVHAKGTSKLVNNDTASATHYIDVEAPIGPTVFTSTPTSPLIQPGGKIDLAWNSASDPNRGAGDGLHPVTPYIIKRSVAGGTDPAPYCIDGDTVPIILGQLTFTDSGLNDSQAPIYHYRVCAMDDLGNVSAGVTAQAASSYTNYCFETPLVSLGTPDPLNPLLIQDQLVKSEGGSPFPLTISSRNVGDCPNTTFNIALVETSTTGGTCTTCDATDPPPSLDDFIVTYPSSLLLGKTAGPGGTNKTSGTVSITINARPYADQIQKYIFKAQVTATGITTVTTDQATAILNDMPPIVHNANNMGKFQYGTWGNTYTCATCHSNHTTNIKGVYQIISTPIGNRKVVFTKISSTTSDYTGVYSNDLRPNKNGSDQVCNVCHHQTRQHQYSANKLLGGPAGQEVEYNPDHHNSRDCVKCHTHNTAFRSIYGSCGDCHGFKGTDFSPINRATMAKPPTNALGPNPPSYGAHVPHNYAEMTCAVCHSNTNHAMNTDTWFGDTMLEIGFQIDNTTYPGFNPATPVTGGMFEGTTNLNDPYTWVAGPGTTITPVVDYNASCTTYCHGGWSGNVGSNTKPNWVGTGQASCGTCHNGTLAVPSDSAPLSGSHQKHSTTGATGLGMACIKCHGTYTMAQYTGAKHINGQVEWSLSAAYPGSTYNGVAAGTTNALAPTNPASYATCTNLYCHSNVQGVNGIGAPTSYAVPLWGDNGDDSGTVFCGSCHIYPNTVGGHAQHENEVFAFDCHVCHNNGGRTSPQHHADNHIDFEFVGLGANTVYSKGNSVTPGLGYGTCSASDCHGRYTRAWGPPSALPLCDKCHGSQTSPRGFYNTRGPDGTLSIYSTAIGVHDIHLQNPNSPRKATFRRFTSFSVGMSCNQCHYNPEGPFTAGHMDNPLPAEVPFAHMSSLADEGELFGYYSSPTYSFATQRCSSVWCHGAGMLSNTSRGKYAGTTPGITRVNPQWNQPILASGDPCTKCHAMPPPAPNSSYTHWNLGAGRPFSLTECVGCHQHLNNSGTGFINKSLHINAVIDGGCTGCHGDPPTTTGIGTETGLATPDQHALQLGTAGAHDAHIKNINIKKDCYVCHYNYNPVMISDGTGKLEIGFNGFGGKVKTGTFTGYTNTVNGPKWQVNSAPGGTTTLTKVNGTVGQEANICSNLYCHGSTITSGTLKNPDWEGSGQAACGTCHGGSPADVPFPAQSGAHTRHASDSVGGLQLSCETCHGQSGVNMTHVDADVQWELNQNNQKIGTAAAYRNLSAGRTGNLAPSASYGNCTNFYCHSNVQGVNGVGAPTDYKVVTWGSSTALTCSGCHSAMSSGAATGSHVGHAQTSGYACGTCHHDGGEDKETHADGLIFVNMTSTVGGTYANNGRDAGSAAGYGTCSATACHGTVSPTWGTSSGKPKCEICHGFRKSPWNAFNGQTVNTDPKVGAHFNHISSNSVAPKISRPISCLACHSDSISQSSDNIAAAGHMNNAGSNKVNIAGGGTYSAGTCTNVYCHGATLSGGVGGTSPVWNVPFLTGVGSNDCVKCHARPPLIPDHIKTQPSTYYGPTECITCHKHTNANGDGFTDPSLHINGVVEGGDCISCHSSVKGVRAAVVGQFASQSHHIQGNEPLTNAQCYKCHWEANSDGSVNATYHGKTSTAGVSLVNWKNSTTRPATVNGTTYISYTANGTRGQIAKLNDHCLGCHDSTPNRTAPFGTYATDVYSPEPKLVGSTLNKAKTSILSRYSSTRTVAWSNYTFTNSSGNIAQYGTNKKNLVTKALSAHGKATLNQFPMWSATLNGPGEDKTMIDAATATAKTNPNKNVFCYDCHNSHGSNASGVTSSYSSATGKYKGGLLKTTISNQGGYNVTYTPAARTIYYKNYSTTATTAALFNTGASICNDCHNDDTRKVNINKPWSITGTYSSTRAIVGYWSTPYFDNYTVNSVKRTTYKGGYGTGVKDLKKPMGGHYGSSVNGTQAAHSGEVNGLCTPCHDPHGVSNALGADRDHGVPLLKGTWVTSPYREDKATPAVHRGGGSTWAGITGGGGAAGYNIDQNTLLNMPAPLNAGATSAVVAKSAKRAQTFRNISNNALKLHNEKTPSVFAGLCLECHSQTSLTGSGSATTTQAWMSKERVHQSVAGWGPTNGTNVNNKVHAYTCSKCHAPHVSRLPRLMVTNCLDVRHFQRGLNKSISTTSGTAATSYGNIAQTVFTSSALGAGRFPGGGTRYSGVPGTAKSPGGWYFQNNNPANVQPTVQSFGSNCHNAAGAGGAAYDPTKQIWNKKTRW